MNSVDLEEYYQDLSSILPKLGLNDNQVSELVNEFEGDIVEGVHILELEDRHLLSFTCIYYCRDYADVNNVTISIYNKDNKAEYDIYDGYKVERINDKLYIFEKTKSDIVYNTENKNYFRIYVEIEEQGLLNNEGKIIFRGDLGDYEKLRIVDNFLLLEKDKYSSKQKEQINYYFDNFIEYQDKKEFCDKADLLSALDFEEVFSSDKVADGKFITSTFEDYCCDYSDDDEDEPMLYNSIECNIIDYTKYTDTKLYSIFDLNKHLQLFPFQPNKILINPSGKRGIFLENEKEKTPKSYGYQYDPLVVNNNSSKFTVDSEDNHYFVGQVFYTAGDTFRAGSYTGISIARLFKQRPKTVIKYVQCHDIYITTLALLQLEALFKHSHKHTICQLVTMRERFFNFDFVNYPHERINSHYLIYGYGRRDVSIFQGKTLREILSQNSQYLISLINSDYYFIHPNALEGLEDLPCYDRFYESVNNIYEIRQSEWEWQREMEDIKAQRDFDRMEIETGWKTAFGDDPESEWNID